MKQRVNRVDVFLVIGAMILLWWVSSLDNNSYRDEIQCQDELIKYSTMRDRIQNEIIKYTLLSIYVDLDSNDLKYFDMTNLDFTVATLVKSGVPEENIINVTLRDGVKIPIGYINNKGLYQKILRRAN